VLTAKLFDILRCAEHVHNDKGYDLLNFQICQLFNRECIQLDFAPDSNFVGNDVVTVDDLGRCEIGGMDEDDEPVTLYFSMLRPITNEDFLKSRQ
jgi:hypothetical protein